MLEYQKQQAGFAAHIRNPDKFSGPGDIEDRRMKIYRDLFFSNIEGFVSGAFPVFKSLFSEENWLVLIRDFIECHASETPYFLEISQEFLKYLEDPDLPLHQQFPFAQELAHYEWVELALDVADEVDLANVNPNGDLLAENPVVSAVAWPLLYQWPVHHIGADYLPDTPEEQPVCLIVYRTRNDDIEFMEANPVTLRLLEIIEQDNCPTGEAALVQLAEEMQQVDAQAIINFGLPILEQLRAAGIILGTQ